MPENQVPALRLLVVDDDDGIRSLLRAIFRRSNIDVDFVADGRSALERLGSIEYDVVLLDLMLPLASGFEVIAALKTTGPQMLARTIVLTAASERMLRDFDDAGLVRLVIHKPFEIDQLVSEVLSCGGRGAGVPETARNPH